MDRFLFDLNPNPVIIYDETSLRILEANRAFLQKYGYKEKELEELTLENIRPKDQVEQLYEVIENFSDEGVNETKLVQHQSKEGEIFYVDLSAHPFPYDNRKARVVFIHDVTERVMTERKAERAFFELSHHIDESPLAMIKWDKEFNIIEWSKRAQEIFGYRREQVLGKSADIINFHTVADRTVVEENIEQVLSGDQDLSKFDIKIENREGQVVYLRVHGSALRDDEGDLISALTFLEDITEQKKAEQKYQRLFENANDGILLAKRDKWIDCNDKLLEILGAKREDILRKSPLDFSPEEQPDGNKSSEKIQKKIARALEGRPQVFEWQHLKKDGTPIDVEVSLNRLDLGEEVYVQAIIRDLTEQKKAELKYQRLFENANDGIFLMKEDRFIECNDEVCNIYGCNKSEIIGCTPMDFSPDYQPDGRRSDEKAHEKISNALAGDPQVFEWKHEKKDGTPVDTEVSLNKLELGDEVYVQAIVRDLTEQKKAQEKLRESEEMFRKLFLKAPGALIMVDKENRIKKVNQSFEELFGYSEEELLGRDLDKVIVSKEEYNSVPRMPGTDFREGKFYDDVVRYTKDGEARDILLGAIPVYLDGEPIAGFGIYIDVTDRKETERKLKKSLKEKQVLLEEIHHRVKNNLAIISGFLQLQAFEIDDKKTKEVLNDSQLRIQSIAIVHEMLYQSNDFVDISFETYVKRLINEVKSTLPLDHQHIDIEINTTDVMLDINQAIPCAILINELVTNSYKHAFRDKKSGNIWVNMKNEEDHIFIEVKDDGVGLPEGFSIEEQSSIGMNIIQTLIEQLNGSLEISNSEGGCFRIQFEKSKRFNDSAIQQLTEEE